MRLTPPPGWSGRCTEEVEGEEGFSALQTFNGRDAEVMPRLREALETWTGSELAGEFHVVGRRFFQEVVAGQPAHRLDVIVRCLRNGADPQRPESYAALAVGFRLPPGSTEIELCGVRSREA